MQSVAQWWQRYVLGRLPSPQDIIAEARKEMPDGAQASERFFDDPLDGQAFDAPARLAAPSMLAPSEAMLKLWDKADWQYVDPRLRYFAASLQEAARKRGIPLYVHSAFRTKAEQDKAVSEGRSHTRYPTSAHNIGEAVDIVHAVYHWTLTPREWLYISKLAWAVLDRMNAGLPKDKRLYLEWGGMWSYYDPAHWQIVDYKSRTRALSAGEPRRLTPRYILRHLKV